MFERVRVARAEEVGRAAGQAAVEVAVEAMVASLVVETAGRVLEAT